MKVRGTLSGPYVSACTELVHSLHQCTDVLRLHVRRQAVAEVEDVAFARAAIAVAVAVERAADFATDGVGFGVQRDRVEVALDRDLAAGAACGVAEFDRPVDADGFRAARRQILDIRRIALAEQDQRCALAPLPRGSSAAMRCR